MRWVAIFDDVSEPRDIRLQQREAHFDYLARNADRIRLAGGLKSGPDELWIGGLWVIDADSREAAASLCEEDPFFAVGLRSSYRLFLWGRAPCYGAFDSVML